MLLKIPKIIPALRLFIFSILQNLRNFQLWKWTKSSSKNIHSIQYFRQLPTELIDESLRFFPYKKCLELSKSSRSYYLANLAEYRAKRFPKKLPSTRRNRRARPTLAQRLLSHFGMVTEQQLQRVKDKHRRDKDKHQRDIAKLVRALNDANIAIPSMDSDEAHYREDSDESDYHQENYIV